MIRLKTDIISGKASVESANRAGESGRFEHLDWLKMDLNAAKIITVEDYKHTKN